ncbi:MAG: hypothetical protein LBV45_05440 [Xanthomonadaceae bacterium]|jgi:hypothetical protein|nr:hypothetical protein [Xanthomonadaceae bacterium]
MSESCVIRVASLWPRCLTAIEKRRAFLYRERYTLGHGTHQLVANGPGAAGGLADRQHRAAVLPTDPSSQDGLAVNSRWPAGVLRLSQVYGVLISI